MKRNILILDPKFAHLFSACDVHVTSPMDYILNFKKEEEHTFNIYNLANSLNYQGIGYYVSLLALARNHKIFPSPVLIQDLKNSSMQKIFSEEFEDLFQKKLARIQSDRFEMSIYFGRNLTEKYDSLAKDFYRMFRAPLLRVYFERQEQWSIEKVKILKLSDVPASHHEFLSLVTTEYFSSRHRFRSKKDKTIYDLAILVNPEEPSPPSDQKAVKKFVQAGKEWGIHVDLVTKKDATSILEYDALFIRETTNVNHHTFRLARIAQHEGMVVIDDPDSIIRCTNKVFLEELLDRLQILRPKSFILSRQSDIHVPKDFEFPLVIKKPDSAFSQGVYKAKSIEEFYKITEDVFKASELLLVQEFLPTDFDWRVGILNNEVLYVCRYYMAKDHWQIVNNQSQKENEGNFDCMDPKLAPKEVLKTALKACKAIGSGLYGVDLKQVGNKVYVIEVNDNPSIDSGVEDHFLGDKLYSKVMEYFFRELNKKRRIHV